MLVLALGVRLLNLWHTAGLPIASYQFDWPESDMTANFVWSGRILRGDVLGRDGVHPSTGWMRDIAPQSTWQRWWGGNAVFQQAPLYAYTLAGIRWLAGDSFLGIGLVQALLGTLNVGLVFLLARHLFDPPAPTIAALGAALYGPFLLHETLLLRDIVAVTSSLLLLWALVRCDDDAPPLRWSLAGALLAVAILARETTLLFAPFVAVWIVQRRWKRPAGLRAGPWWLVAGGVLGLVPLVARNLAVGVPAWALSNRTLETVALGHAVGGSPVGVVFQPAAKSVLLHADGDLGAAIRLTLASYDGDWSRLLRSEAIKLAAVFSRFEGMDNVDWYYFVDRSPFLRYSLHFEAVLTLGLLGLVLAGRGTAPHRVVRYFLLSAVIGLVSFTVIGRYRLPAVSVLFVYAGVTVAWAARGIADRHWTALALGGAAAVAFASVSATLLRPIEERLRYRPTEFIMAAKVYYARRQPERVFDELRDALQTAYAGADQPRLAESYLSLAADYLQIAHDLGRDAEAAIDLARLAELHPADPDVQELVGRAYDGLGRGDVAAKYFAEARRLRGR